MFYAYLNMKYLHVCSECSGNATITRIGVETGTGNQVRGYLHEKIIFIERTQVAQCCCNRFCMWHVYLNMKYLHVCSESSGNTTIVRIGMETDTGNQACVSQLTLEIIFIECTHVCLLICQTGLRNDAHEPRTGSHT